MNLKFEQKYKTGGKRNGKDCSVSVYKKANDSQCCIVFRNGIAKKISSTGYIVYAMYENKLYFKSEDNDNGYKLSEQTGNSYKIETRNKNLKSFIENRQGGYDMKFDKENNLYYIELKEK